VTFAQTTKTLLPGGGTDPLCFRTRLIEQRTSKETTHATPIPSQLPRGSTLAQVRTGRPVGVGLDLLGDQPGSGCSADHFSRPDPATASVSLGATASFRVIAYNNVGEFRYQWHFNEAPLPGATGDTLTLRNIDLSQSARTTSSFPTTWLHPEHPRHALRRSHLHQNHHRPGRGG